MKSSHSGAGNSHSWQRVLQETRRNRSAKTSMGEAPAAGSAALVYDMRIYLRGRAFTEWEGQPEPLVRARAFAAVLDNIGLHAHNGEIFAGSIFGFLRSELPEGVSKEDYERAAAVCASKKRRNFGTCWDHTLGDYPTLLAGGIDGLRQRIYESASSHGDLRERVCLQAMRETAEALARFIRRHAAAARERGDGEQAAMLERISGGIPATLREAMQLLWLTHIAFCSENRYHMALGRIDQYLLLFYREDLRTGRLTEEEALDLFCHLWAKIEELGEVTNICIGGLTPDGADAVNELSYIALEATRLVQSPHTNLSARLHDGVADAFLAACFDCVKTGVGFPAVFNDHVTIAGLMEIGIPAEIARDYCMVGCIETMLPGRQQAWSDSRFNTPLSLLGALREFDGGEGLSWERFRLLLEEHLSRDIAAHCCKVDEYASAVSADECLDPFLSLLTQDCIARARDINDGGALFRRFHGIAIMGLGTMADSMAAVKKLVFEEERICLKDLKAALESNFAGFEPLRRMLLHRAPKYGNADAYVDELAAWLVDFTARECLKHRLADGGRFVSAMAANIQNISAGAETGATPDGRLSGERLSDAASPFYGRDANGPTAFLQSVAVPDYHLVLTGSVINMRFDPEHFQGEKGVKFYTAFLRAFLAGRVQELQFNFSGEELLRNAFEHPEEYAGLVVRVSGFSAYFTRLERKVQEDIMLRWANGQS